MQRGACNSVVRVVCEQCGVYIGSVKKWYRYEGA